MNRKLEVSRIDCLYPHAGNIEGSNIRASVKRMLEHKDWKRLLVVISDGEPAGSCVPGVCAEEDVVRAVDFANKHSINVIGVGIPGVSPERFRLMYSNNYVFENMEGFHKKFADIIIKTLRK
jgi:nitric oxide reductase activation protein